MLFQFLIGFSITVISLLKLTIANKQFQFLIGFSITEVTFGFTGYEVEGSTLVSIPYRVQYNGR